MLYNPYYRGDKVKTTLSLIKKMSFNILYISAILICLVKVGSVSKITTYNVSGVSSLSSSQILSEYVEPKPEILKKEPLKSSQKVYKYRLTSFTDKCVGAGFCGARDFKTNEKGWYLYKGKLVVATATPYLVKTFGYKPNKLYFKYYDELILTIDGVKYEAIVLDTCGACYREERVDLYVKDEKSVIDRGYRGYNMISVEIKKKQK
jgi:hypothetical protein